MNPSAATFPEPSRLSQTLLPPTSRYHGLEIRKRTLASGKSVAYLERRFLPRVEDFATLQEYAVTEGDRIDVLAAQFLGDPEQFWRIADGNHSMNSQKLAENVGSVIRITLPENVPGAELNQ